MRIGGPGYPEDPDEANPPDAPMRSFNPPAAWFRLVAPHRGCDRFHAASFIAGIRDGYVRPSFFRARSVVNIHRMRALASFR